MEVLLPLRPVHPQDYLPLLPCRGEAGAPCPGLPSCGLGAGTELPPLLPILPSIAMGRFHEMASFLMNYETLTTAYGIAVLRVVNVLLNETKVSPQTS